jgi:hypothetical protein
MLFSLSRAMNAYLRSTGQSCHLSRRLPQPIGLLTRERIQWSERRRSLEDKSRRLSVEWKGEKVIELNDGIGIAILCEVLVNGRTNNKNVI